MANTPKNNKQKLNVARAQQNAKAPNRKRRKKR